MRKKTGLIGSLMEIFHHISKWRKSNHNQPGAKDAFLKLDVYLWDCIFILLGDLNYGYGFNELTNADVMVPLYVFDLVLEIWTGFYYQRVLIKKINANKFNNSMKKGCLINTAIRMSLIVITIMLSICTYIKMRFILWFVLALAVIASLIGDGLQICFLVRKNCWK